MRIVGEDSMSLEAHLTRALIEPREDLRHCLLSACDSSDRALPRDMHHDIVGEAREVPLHVSRIDPVVELSEPRCIRVHYFTSVPAGAHARRSRPALTISISCSGAVLTAVA